MRDRWIVVGAGRFGGNLACELDRQGRAVVVIERKQSVLGALPHTFGGLCVCADAREVGALQQAQAGRACALYAATELDNLNFMLALVARQRYGVPHVTVRLNQPSQAPLFEASDINVVDPCALALRACVRNLGEVSP